MKAVAALVTIGLLLPAEVGLAEEAPSPYQFSWGVDAPLLLGAATLWIAPSIANRGNARPQCNPCDGSRINALDREAIGNYSKGWDTTGDVLAALVPALAGLGGLVHHGRYGWRAWGEDALLVAQAMALGGMLNQAVRHAVGRPRPFMYQKDARLELRNDPEAMLSFYSGHTSTVFSATAAFTTSYFLRRPDSWTRWLVLGGGLAISSIMPISRVAAGEHFPSDVITGAIVGTAIGVLLPVLHKGRGSTKVQLGASVQGAGWSASLMGSF